MQQFRFRRRRRRGNSSFNRIAELVSLEGGFSPEICPNNFAIQTLSRIVHFCADILPCIKQKNYFFRNHKFNALTFSFGKLQTLNLKGLENI